MGRISEAWPALAPPGGCFYKDSPSFSPQVFEAVRSSRALSCFCAGDLIFIR